MKTVTKQTYAIGAVNIRKYTDLFIYGCVTCFVAGIVLATLILGITFTVIYRNTVKNYESQIQDRDIQLATIETTHQTELDRQESYQQKLRSTVELENIDLQDRIMELETEVFNLTDTLSNSYGDEEADFDLVKQYSYVLDQAPAKSGLTLDHIRYLDQVCREWDVNPHWMWAIYDVESSFKTNVDSSLSTARGLGQVLESTATEIWEKVLGHGRGSYSHAMAYNPYVNMEISTCLIGRNLAKGTMENAINLYGDQTDTYYGKVLAAGKDHGITLTENNAHYPG